MWEKFRAIFTIPELRQKIYFTLLLLLVFRIGYAIPLPVTSNTLPTSTGWSDFLSQASMFSGADLKRLTVFGLGIMPYISASIILQLLGSVWKPLEDLRKEGEVGRKKINEYTRYLTVAMCFVQGIFFLKAGLHPSAGANNVGSLNMEFSEDGTNVHWSWFIACVCIMTCGTMFVMWIGEQIDEFGIGNGISLLIMAGILAQMPMAVQQYWGQMQEGGSAGIQQGVGKLAIMLVIFAIVVACVVFMQLGQRQITTQSAKHVRGRRVYGGSKQYLPLRLNQSGVMPIIFASSLMMIPAMGFKFLSGTIGRTSEGTTTAFGKILATLDSAFTDHLTITYNLTYILLIFFFSYFWTAITFNPKEMAENLKEYGTFIPGYRPGRRTADYLEKVMVRITFVGAAFLSLVAIIPTIISSGMQVPPNVANFYGGTGLLIAVSVAFDLIQKIDSHLVMRDYRGLLEP